MRKPADVRIIASSIQVVNDEHGWECWGNMPRERRRLFDLVRSTRANGVVFVSGDRHFTELSRDDVNGPYVLYDFTSSGLTEVARRGASVPNSKRVGSAVSARSFGGVTIDFAEEGTTVLFEAFGVKGETLFAHRVSSDDLKF